MLIYDPPAVPHYYYPNINATAAKGSTPLHMAALSNSLEVARLLINSGADIERTGEIGKPLYYAASKKSLGVVRLLIEKGASTDGIDLRWMK